MSGITGKDALGIFEAYQSIYTSQELDEGLRPLPKEKMERQATKAYGKEVRAAAAGNEKETNKQMKRRFAIQNPASRRTELLNKEEVDIYDIIFSHLLDEGYADTPEAAEAIMVNMSEEWKDGILEAVATLHPEDDEKTRTKIKARIKKIKEIKSKSSHPEYLPKVSK